MFKKINTSGSYLYRVESCEQLKSCVVWAAKTAFYKASYTVDSWQKRPNKYAKFVDIFYGDYAKNIVKCFIESKIDGVEIVEYDKVRTDDFKEHDLFDLKICNKEIEIKSSLEKHTKSINEIFDNRRIIVNVYGSHETLSDFVVQVFFVPEDLSRFEIIENFNKQNPNMPQDMINQKCREEMNYAFGKTSIYICGWINKEMELNAIKEAKSGSAFEVKNYGSNAHFRKYANVMIKDSKHMDELIDAIKDLCLKTRRRIGMETKGYIYILTNPSFPQFVKIGYADDVEARAEQLNRSECVPYAFRVYAYYAVTERLNNLKLHALIDKLNPNLRSIEEFNGKKMVREFYAMSPEDAYSILETIAEINGMKDKLVLVEKTKDQIKDEKEAEEITLNHNRHHFREIVFSCSLTGKTYKGTTNKDGTLSIIEKDTGIEIPNNSKPSKKAIVGSALEDLGYKVDKDDTLYQCYHRLTKVLNGQK